MNEKLKEQERRAIEADALVEFAKSLDNGAERIGTYNSALFLYALNGKDSQKKFLETEKLIQQTHADIAFKRATYVLEFTANNTKHDLDKILDLESELNANIKESEGVAETIIGFDKLINVYQNLENYLVQTVLPELDNLPFEISSVQQKVNTAVINYRENKKKYKYQSIRLKKAR